MNRWKLKTDLKLAGIIPYLAVAAFAAFNICVRLFACMTSILPASNAHFQCNMFLYTDFLLPLLLVFAVVTVFSNDFAKGTYGFLLTLPIHGTRLSLLRFFRLLLIFLAVYILSLLNCLFVLNDRLTTLQLHITFGGLIFLTVPNVLFAGSLALFTVVLTRQAFYSTTLTGGWIMFEMISRGIFSKKLMLFVNIFAPYYTDSAIIFNRVFFILLSVALIASSYFIIIIRDKYFHAA